MRNLARLALPTLLVSGFFVPGSANAQDCATTPPATCSDGNQVEITFGEPPTNETCFGCPLGSQNGTWSPSSSHYRQLQLPKFALNGGACGTLIQAELTVTYRSRTTIRVENLDDKPQTVNVAINLATQLTPLNVPGLAPISVLNNALAAYALGAGDGVIDFDGPAGETDLQPDALNTMCIRVTDPLVLANFIASAGSEFLLFDHNSIDGSFVTGPGNLTSATTTDALVSVSVTYRSCECQTVAGNDAVSVCIGEQVSISILKDDTTTCGTVDPQSIVLIGTYHPAFLLSGTNLHFDATGVAPGVYVAHYSVCNDQSPPCCHEATITITVCETVANDDEARVCVGAKVAVNVLGNDTTTCGILVPASVTLVGTPPPGFSVVDGQVVYAHPGTPLGGTVSATYSVCNDLPIPCCDTAVVTVTICSVDGVDDEARVCVGATVITDVLANDTTNCGALVPGPLGFVGVPPPGFAIVGGQIAYTHPGLPTTGTVSAVYRVCNDEDPACCGTATLTVTICNVTALDDLARVCAGASVTTDVLANDSTNCGVLLSATLDFVGVPPPGFSILGSEIVYANTGMPTSGTVSANYTICNDEDPNCCDTATLTVTICSVNAVDDTARVCAGSSVTTDVLANDSTNCGMLVPGSVEFVGTPPPGFTIVGGQIAYANPGMPVGGTISVTYRVCNDEMPPCCDTATLTVTVCSVDAIDDSARVCVGEQVKIDVLANDSTTCGVLVGNSLTFVGTPPRGFSIVGGQIVYANAGTPPRGTDSATYRVCNDEDPACCDTAVVTVTICRTDALDDEALVCAGTTVTIPVLANDSTTCGLLVPSSLSFEGAPPPGFSIVAGAIVYTNTGLPDSGTLIASYRICNDEDPPCCDTATVAVTICSVVADDDEMTMCCGDSMSVNVLSNDLSSCGRLDCAQVELLTPYPAGFSVSGCVITYDSNLGACPPTATARYRIRGGTGLVCSAEAEVVATILSRPIAMDDRIDLLPTTTFPLEIDVLANDQPGKNCTFEGCAGCAAGPGPKPCAVRLVTTPAFGTATVQDDCTILYVPDPTFSTGDTFCYEVTNSCDCSATACVTIASCREVDRRTCGSLLLFPEYDNRAQAQTIFTLTNGCCDLQDGNMTVEFRFIDALTCFETDFTLNLTPCDTVSFLTSAVNPNSTRGYAYAFVKRPTPGSGNPNGMPIVHNTLIGQAMIIDGLDLVKYSMNAVSFIGLGVDLSDNDDDGDGIRDLNGPLSPLAEYEQAPDEILIPRFLGQDPPGVGMQFQSDLILIGLSGGSAFTTTVEFLVYNDSEDVTSQFASFTCWDKRRLAQWAPGTLSSVLTVQGDDPDEILGSPTHTAGWIRLDGVVAESKQEVILDPAIYAVLIERMGERSVADLPFEKCAQANGDLLPNSLFGDGPNPVAGDGQ